MNKKYLMLFAVSGAVVALDQLSKVYVHTHFQQYESMAVIPNLFNLTYVRNTGAAFGFLAGSHPSFREIFFLMMPPVALLIILTILRGVQERDRWQVLALSLVFGGAIGNYIDRLRFRFVVDFLDFTYRYMDGKGAQQTLTWPAFNVADMAIVTGVSLLLLLMFIRRDEQNQSTVSAS